MLMFFQGLSDEAAKVVYQMKRAKSVGEKGRKAAMLNSGEETGYFSQNSNKSEMVIKFFSCLTS